MTIYCALAGHRASPDTISNGGHNFARCARCKADLVEQAGAWSSPPKGFRIVWRKAEGSVREHSALDVIELATALAAEPEAPSIVEPTPEAETELLLEETAPEEAEPPLAAPLERRRVERRAPGGSHPNFAGPDRRRQHRRQEFGKRTGARASTQS